VQLSTISHLDISGCNLNASGGFHLAGVIKDMRALSVLSLKDNMLATKEGGKALAQALANNPALKELDISDNNWRDGYGNWLGDGPGFAQELTVGIKDNGALTKLTFGDQQVVTMTTEMTEANFSGKLKSHEAQIVAAFLPKCT
jgi:hypothetical protein